METLVKHTREKKSKKEGRKKEDWLIKRLVGLLSSLLLHLFAVVNSLRTPVDHWY